MNSKIVMKFGGTSLGSSKKIQQAALKIKNKLKKNSRIIVVVSAMSGVTNKLIKKTEIFSSCKFSSLRSIYVL